MGSVFNRGTKERPLWYPQYRENGRWKMANSRQTSKAKALRFLHAAEERVAQGKVGIEPEKPGTPFDAVADEWLRLHSKVELVSHNDNVGRMKHLLEEFGKRQVADITAARVDPFKARMAAGPKRDAKGEPVTDPKTGEEIRRWAPATVNRTLALLRKVLNDCVRWGHLTHAPKVRLLKVPEQRRAWAGGPLDSLLGQTRLERTEFLVTAIRHVAGIVDCVSRHRPNSPQEGRPHERRQNPRARAFSPRAERHAIQQDQRHARRRTSATRLAGAVA